MNSIVYPEGMSRSVFRRQDQMEKAAARDPGAIKARRARGVPPLMSPEDRHLLITAPIGIVRYIPPHPWAGRLIGDPSITGSHHGSPDEFENHIHYQDEDLAFLEED